MEMTHETRPPMQRTETGHSLILTSCLRSSRPPWQLPTERHPRFLAVHVCVLLGAPPLDIADGRNNLKVQMPSLKICVDDASNKILDEKELPGDRDGVKDAWHEPKQAIDDIGGGKSR